MASTSDLVPLGSRQRPFSTFRTDAWWLGPTLTVLGLSLFLVYSTWAMLQGNHYLWGPYLSPMYEPLLWVKSGVPGGAPVAHAWFGEWPGWIPAFIPASPAFLILAFPGSFRFTCYYYRKAYYRSFAATPPACAVPGVVRPGKYPGETKLLVFQNLHRYALYFALAFIPLLYIGAIRGFFYEGHFGVGVGSIVLLVNATLLAGYTFGCHSWRHLIGGRLNCFSCDPVAKTRYTAWKRSTWLNERHQLFAWTSLFFVMFTDLYVRLVSHGVLHDFNTWGL